MKPASLPSLAAFALFLALPAHATSVVARDAATSTDIAAITSMVNDFLEHVDQRDTHDRFWATDLVYTSSSGEVTDKASIMKGFEAPPEAAEAPAEDAKTADATPATGAPAPTPDRYAAEDLVVRPYGDAAALTFRLVHIAPDGKRSFYRNSGMLLRRDGRWQVVTWQATKVPEPEAR
ncbi:MAG: nuclear transport factor 2 family protein [Arenimonas sp.]